MSDPKRQHTVPHCYLKQFVDPHAPAGHEPYVWIFDRGNKKGQKRAPRNVLTETDIYTFKGKDGSRDYSLEKSLAQIESDYASAFECKISKKLPLNRSEHTVLCAFVAAMLQRTLKQKKHIERIFDQMISMAENLEKANGLPAKKSLELKEAKANAHRTAIVQSVPEMANILSKMNVAFLSTNGAGSFITSDAPCFLLNSQLQFERLYAPGLGQKYVEVRMPLSPEISATFTWANNLRGYLVIGKDWIHEHNRMVFGYSDAHFIANSAKLKRQWFRRFPLDPVFVARIIRAKTKRVLQDLRHKIHG